MKIFLRKLPFLIFLLNVTRILNKLHMDNENSNSNLNSINSSFTNTPCLNLKNFDAREKFRSCFNNGYSSIYDEINCFTNWPIQFTIMLTDKLCIQKGMGNKLISSMNLNSCMKLKDTIQNCKSLRSFYNDTTSTFEVVNETIKFFNINGSQYLDENPYKLIRDSFDTPAYFPECSIFNSSIKNVTIDTDYQIYDENNDDEYNLIKNLIFQEGPLLAYLDSTNNIINF